MTKGIPGSVGTQSCSVEGCTRVYRCSGFCERHYSRWRATGDPLTPDRRRGKSGCLIEGCNGAHKGHGYCRVHYQNFVRCGDPLKFGKVGISKCIVDDCGRDNAAGGYCTGHSRRFKKYGDPLATPYPLPKQGPCTVENCTVTAIAKGLCKRHYRQSLSRATADAKMAERRAQYAPEMLDAMGRIKRPVRMLDERVERALLKIDYNGPYPTWRPDLDRCHVWTASSCEGGYVPIVIGKGDYVQRYFLHRVLWERANGPIPDPLCIDHLCRVGRCMNVSHFEVVTREENSRRGTACARCLFLANCPDCGTDLRGHGRVVPPTPCVDFPYLRESMEQKFLRYTTPGPFSELVGSNCLDWIGPRNEQDYGYLKDGKKRMGAHRYAIIRDGTTTFPGWESDHLCRRPCCVRRDHLEAVTKAVNISRRHVCARCILLKSCPSCHLDIASVTSADRWRVAA